MIEKSYSFALLMRHWVILSMIVDSSPSGRPLKCQLANDHSMKNTAPESIAAASPSDPSAGEAIIPGSSEVIM